MLRTLMRSLVPGIALLLGTMPSVSLANSGYGFNQTYEPDGWYFYRDPVVVEIEESEEPEPQVFVPQKPVDEQEEVAPVEVKITSAWLRENLPLLLDAAQDEPTYENVRRYHYAQRIAVDRASLFAKTFERVYRNELALNEKLRRPDNNQELQVHKAQLMENRRKLLEATYSKVGIFFFFESRCEYCIAMVDHIRRLSKLYKLDILPVSLDGFPLPNAPDLEEITIYDDGTLTSMMPVEVTPTFYLFNKETYEAGVISKGYITSEDLLLTSFLAMHETGVITEQEFQLTQAVRDVYLIPTDGSDLVVNEQELYDNPDYLADKLRNVFNERYLNAEDSIISDRLPTPSNGRKQELSDF